MEQDVKLTFRPGSVIANKFEIIRVMGEGSLGDDLYLGKQLDMEREVIIRMLPPEVARDQEMLNRFKQEIKLSATLQHPNIRPAYETGEYNGRYYYITGYEHGTYLSEFLETRGPLEEHEAVSIVMALADALRYAWEDHKVIHRNIKPDTIFIGRNDKPILEDFGMAKSSAPQQAELTMMNVTIGNPDYMSPEQVRGMRDLDFRSDMYCLGLVFYEILTGIKAFNKPTQVALMQAQLTENPRSVRELNPQVSGDCCVVLSKMLRKSRDERYQEWVELIADMKALLENRRIASAKEEVGDVIKYKNEQQAKEKETNKLLIILIIIIIALLAAIVALILPWGGR